MRVYSDAVEMLNETTREVFSRGHIAYDETLQGKKVTREYEAKELLGYNFTLTPAGDETLEAMLEWASKTFKKPHLCKAYGDDWFNATIAVDPLAEKCAHYQYYPEYWHKFGGFPYSYAQRVGKALPKVIALLKESKYRRGAVLPIYLDYDLQALASHLRVPCSLLYNPIIRRQGLEDQLSLVYVMRSCDLVNWFPLDVYRAIRTKQYLAEQLEVKPGALMTHITSLHAHKADVARERRW